MRFICLLACCLLTLNASAVGAADQPDTDHVPWQGQRAVFQYAYAVALAEGKTATAYLWVPAEAPQVRGLLVGGSVLFEGSFAAHPAIRAACAKAGVGIVYFSPHLDATFTNEKSPALLEEALAGLAKAAGRDEITSAPLLPYGHSVGTIWSRNVLFWKPERCFGAIFFKGGFGVPEGKKLSDIAGIPLLHLQGRFEEFGPGPSGVLRKDASEDRSTGGKTAMQQLGDLRKQDPNFLMGLFVEDGSTHFAMNDRDAERMAAYIEGAASLRIPAQAGALIAVKPEQGAYSAAGDLFAKPAAPAAAAADYTGDKAATFWHPTVEQAKAADAFHAVAQGKQAQFCSVADGKGNPMPVAHDMRLKVSVTFTGPDTFTVNGAFWNKAPDMYPPVDGAVSHAEGPVRVRVFSGNLEELGKGSFRVTLDPRWGRPFVLAYHDGDAAYRHCEQPGNTRFADKLKDGKAQTITFADHGTVPAAKFPLALGATSDSGLEVRYYVDHGPARVVDGKLELAEIPSWATGNLEIEVVAYQYGSAVEPKVQSAEAVRRKIVVTR